MYCKHFHRPTVIFNMPNCVDSYFRYGKSSVIKNKAENIVSLQLDRLNTEPPLQIV